MAAITLAHLLFVAASPATRLFEHERDEINIDIVASSFSASVGSSATILADM